MHIVEWSEASEHTSRHVSKTSRRSGVKPLVFFCICAALGLFLTQPCYTMTVNVNFTGLASNGQGLVAHGYTGPNFVPTPFDEFGDPIPAGHPVGDLDGVYTELATRDLFDTVTGDESPITALSSPFGASAPAASLAAVGLNGPLHVSLNNQFLDVSAPTDYYMETALFGSNTFIEHRFYRGGNMRLVHESSPGTYDLVADYVDFTTHMIINYNTGFISGTASGTNTGSSPFFLPVTYTFSSNEPIQVDGSSTEGRYAFFDLTGGFEFDISDPQANVPEPATGMMLLFAGLGICGVARHRRRKA